MIQLWSAVAVAFLTVVIGPLLRGEVSARLPKRIKVHADLREALGDNESGKKELDELLTFEVAALRRREEHRLTRKVNSGTVGALVLVAGAGGGIVYGLVAWALAIQPSSWILAVLIYIVAACVGFITIAFASVGLGTLYDPPKTSEEKKAEKAAKAAKKAAATDTAP